jgi:hypothetical protein
VLGSVMNDELEGIQKEAFVAISKYCPGTGPEGLTKTPNNVNRGSFGLLCIKDILPFFVRVHPRCNISST